MNHLAHCWLARSDDALVVGALLGDFARGGLGTWPAPLAAGIRLHRRIDSYTDAHPLVAQARALFAPGLRRWAGVLLDLWFDHLLATDFAVLTGTTLRGFADRVYAIWAAADDPALPPSFHLAAARLTRHDALAAYADREHLERVLGRVAQRIERANPVATAMPQLEALERPLQRAFAQLWPGLETFAASTRSPGLSHGPAWLRVAQSPRRSITSGS